MATSIQSRPAGVDTRLLFIDNIRWTLIVLVICHHAAVTYSHVGGWYYMDGPKPGMIPTVLFATFETFNQAYFMGLLFLIAGYFVPRALDSKGAGRFLKDRAARLGFPSLVFMLVIHPFTVYWLLRNFDNPSIPPLTKAYPGFITSGRFLGATGPMWFAVALLLFCAVYAMCRAVSPRLRVKQYPMPGHSQVFALIGLMGVCTFLVRIVQPIGVNVLNMQLCYFSQYILLFTVGIFAYRGNWLGKIPRAFGLFWMVLALAVGIPAWFAILWTSGALQGDSSRLLGGFHWQSAAFSFWESLFCVGMCLGLIVLFRDGFNQQGRFSKWMSRNSFSAYLFHTPLLVAVTLALKNVSAPIGIKFLVAALIAVPVTFLVSGLLRPILPGLRKVL
ncbi:MAG: acyltransferase [Bryobacteraceae bacterium]